MPVEPAVEAPPAVAPAPAAAKPAVADPTPVPVKLTNEQRLAKALAAIDAAPAHAEPEEPEESPPPEATPPEPPKTPQNATEAAEQQKQRDAQRFATMARKERALFAKQEANKAKEAELNKKWQDVQDFEKKLSSIQTNPGGVLAKALGPDWYEKIVEYKLNGGQPTPAQVAQEVDEKLAAFKADQIKEAEVRQKQEHESAMADFRNEVKDFVTQNQAEYELTSIQQAHNLVVWTIEENFRRTRKVLSVKEAADLVEQHLVEQHKKLSAAKKLQSHPASSVVPVATPPAEPAPPRTLSNGMTASTPSLSLPAKTEKERIRRALAALDASR